jgi:nucleoside-triphosphatase THEP1
MASVIVSGAVHVGKTTAIRRAIACLKQSHWRVAGFITSPLWGTEGERGGLEIEDLLSGTRRTLARTDRVLGGAQIGPYSFDPQVMEWADQLADQALVLGCDLLVVDEIGRLELEMGSGFQNTLSTLQLLRLPPALVVVRESLLQPFFNRLPEFHASVVLITEGDRDRAPSRIAAALRGQPIRCARSDKTV